MAAMTHRTAWTRLLPSLVFICVGAPKTAFAQGFGVNSYSYTPYAHPPGEAQYLWMKYGRLHEPLPPWMYPGLSGGPYTSTNYPYSGSYGGFRMNGLARCGPPVPVYMPIPPTSGNSALAQQWRAIAPPIGFGYFGWLGPYRASPRPYPPSVSVWPRVESLAINQVIPVPPGAAIPDYGGCIHLSLKVPQPVAEVFVNGVKTLQTGTDRIYESPPLEAGKTYAYDIVARWIEGGATVERLKTVTGKPGEVVRVDLSAP
jgi:uncharacterized protein (TIGR03000 family)